MYAVVTCQGFQYRVAKDQVLRVPVFEGAEGSAITIGNVHMIAEGENVLLGKPVIPEAAVKAEILSHGRGPKILVGKFKKRKDYRRIRGHRTNYTEIRVTEIVRP